MTALASGEADASAEPTLPPGPESLPVEPCLEPPPPVPVLAPYLGLVSAVLCALGGGWLLLAPYALDYRHGARSTPRGTEIDLATGAAVLAVAAVTAVLFSLALARRLHPSADAEPEPATDELEPYIRLCRTSPIPAPPSAPIPEPEPVPAPAPTPAPDPSGSLRDLLTPLVAALAADLKSRGDTTQGGGL